MAFEADKNGGEMRHSYGMTLLTHFNLMLVDRLRARRGTWRAALQGVWHLWNNHQNLKKNALGGNACASVQNSLFSGEDKTKTRLGWCSGHEEGGEGFVAWMIKKEGNGFI